MTSERSPLIPPRGGASTSPFGPNSPRRNSIIGPPQARDPVPTAATGSTGTRDATNEGLQYFRRALGINISPNSPSSSVDEQDDRALEANPTRHGPSTGVYAAVCTEYAKKKWHRRILTAILYTCHVVQIVVGAALTALGPAPATHAVGITLLGAANTIVAGVMALVRGQGLMEKLRGEELEFLRLKAWIEQTEALVGAGVVAGNDSGKLGDLVEEGFRRYTGAKLGRERWSELEGE